MTTESPNFGIPVQFLIGISIPSAPYSDA